MNSVDAIVRLEFYAEGSTVTVVSTVAHLLRQVLQGGQRMIGCHIVALSAVQMGATKSTTQQHRDSLLLLGS